MAALQVIKNGADFPIGITVRQQVETSADEEFVKVVFVDPRGFVGRLILDEGPGRPQVPSALKLREHFIGWVPDDYVEARFLTPPCLVEENLWKLKLPMEGDNFGDAG